MAYADQQMSSNRLIAIIIVALIHIGIGYLLITGLAISAVNQVVERVTAVDLSEPPPPPPEPDEPPPPPPDTPPAAPPPPVAVPPPINIATRPPQIETQTQIPPPAPPVVRIPPPAPPAPVAAPPPPPPPPPAPSRARPASAANQNSWARRIQDNYPSRALNEGTEGRVGVAVTVTPDGRATGCRVTSSSGSSVLDTAACQGIERYGRFNPALDRDGNPTSGSFATTIVYQIT